MVFTTLKGGDFMRKYFVLFLILMLLVPIFGKVNFGSTQMTPAAEREFLLNQLAAFSKSSGIDVGLINFEYPDLLSRLEAEHKTNKITINLVADLQANLYNFAAEGLLADLSDIQIPGVTFLSTLEKYSTFKNQKVFIPWLQATYAMAINKKAFEYLPAGLSKDDVINGTEKWTYKALINWAQKLMVETKTPQLGFPLGPKGLWHRFLHGYIYPSYTGFQAAKFDSDEAYTMWRDLQVLFNYVHPACTTWDSMDQPLLRNEVMIAWDHTARLKQAIVERPNDFVVVPVPRGPEGRGYILVMAGLAIPKGVQNVDEVVKVIEFLTSPQTQVAILQNVGFFPVVKEASNAIPEGALKILAQGVLNQSSAPDSIIATIPGLGSKGGEFTETYRNAFTRIVFYKESPASVLPDLAKKLKGIFEEVGVPIQ